MRIANHAALRAFLGLLSALVVGCGGDADTSAPAPTTAAGSTATTTAEGKTIGGQLILATTTSTQDSGLLDVLVPEFQKQTGIEVKVIAVGTGAALEMAARGDADAVLVHSPTSEKKYVDNKDLVEGQLVMHNDFVIVGPSADAAKVMGLKDLKAAMTAIATTGPFISRGDNSGTHAKELALWSAAGIDPKTGVKNREETGQGMGATLQVASQKRAYTLTDRATFLAQSKNLDLEILFEGEKTLLNIYHVYVVNPEKFAKVQRAQGRAFVAFMVAADTQKTIGEFKKAEYGQSLFFPDAGKDEASIGN